MESKPNELAVRPRMGQSRGNEDGGLNVQTLPINSLRSRFPLTNLIMDFKGKSLSPQEIESDYNSSINYPNNYFVAPKRWRESFFIVSRKNMLQISMAIENIAKVRPPFNRFTFYSLFQTAETFENVRKQYEEIGPLSKALYIIGPTGTGNGSKISNSSLIDSTDSGLDDNWVVVALAEEEGCALVAEEIAPGEYVGFFTTNRLLAARSVSILKNCLSGANPAWN